MAKNVRIKNWLSFIFIIVRIILIISEGRNRKCLKLYFPLMMRIS